MSRFKKTVFMLVAAVMLLAAGTPARAEMVVAGKQRAEIGMQVGSKQQKSVMPAWWRTFLLKLKSRYAMAAN